MIIYTIFDVKAQHHNRPFFLINENVALRTCTQLANDPNSEYCTHAVDFVLYEHGTFDEAKLTDAWDVHAVAKPIVQLIQLKNSRPVVSDLVGGE